MKLSTTFKVQPGDTFDLIARKKYGSEVSANQIATANPGVSEPLVAGSIIIIPTLPDAPTNVQQQQPSDDKDEVAVLIGGQRFRFWNSVRIIRALDMIDTIEISAPFDSTAPGFRETFRPFSFKSLVVNVGGEPLFTGTMMGVNPIVDNDSKTLSMSGYALPGVLNDCNAPASMYSDGNNRLQTDGQGLSEIANALAAPFGIAVTFLTDQGAVFERVAMETGKKVLSYLASLAAQRSLIIASSPKGELIFWRALNDGLPIANLSQGESPVLSVTPFFNAQEYYSHITGIEPVITGLSGSQFTVKNPRLEGIIRPLTYEVRDTKNADMKQAVETKVGRMFGNMVSYTINVNTWREPSGDLWQPNTLINLHAPDAMVYNPYSFIVRSVEFNRESTRQSATLNCVIPGSFSGVLPDSLPWD